MKVQVATISHSTGLCETYVYKWLKQTPKILTICTIEGNERIFTGVFYLSTTVCDEKDAYVEELYSRGISIVPIQLVELIRKRVAEEKHVMIDYGAKISAFGEVKYQTLIKTDFVV